MVIKEVALSGQFDRDIWMTLTSSTPYLETGLIMTTSFFRLRKQSPKKLTPRNARS